MADETEAKAEDHGTGAGTGAKSRLKGNRPLTMVLVVVGLLVVLAVILVWNMMGGDEPTRSPSAAAVPQPTQVPPVPPAQTATPPPVGPGGQQPGQEAAEQASAGGEEAEAEDEEEEEAEAEEEKKQEEADGQPSPAAAGSPSAATPAAQPQPNGAPGSDQGTTPSPASAPAPPGAPAEKPTRPEQVTDWKMADYFSARAENDKRLVEAVGHLGERFAGSPKAGRVAEILAELLAPPKVEEAAENDQQTPAPGVPPQPSPANVPLIEAIVGAIGENGSRTARKILGQLVAGTLPTENDEVTTLAALRALAKHPSAENDAILFRAISAAEELRPEGRGQVTAEKLREQTFSLLESSASERLRIQLAKYMVEPNTPGPLRTKIGGLLEKNHPNNLGAQLVLYQNDNTPQETKTQLEEYFVAYSSNAMGLILGIATDKTGGGTPGAAGGTDSGQPDPDLPYRMARQLWATSCATMLEDALGKLDSIADGPQLVVLAATIPVDSTRATALKTLQEHWNDGPAQLNSAGLLQQTISDPGFLTVLEAVCRRPAPSRVEGKEAREKYQQTKDDWTKFSDDMVRAWCERFLAAAPARAEAGKSSAAGAPESLPITLHTDAKVAAEYHLAWPADAQTQLSGVATGPMEIHYLRIEEKALHKARLGYYRRQLKARTSDVREVGDTDWIDSFRTVPQSDRRRSIDVLITRVAGRPAESSAGNPKDRKEADEAKVDEELVIEILSVEIKDPAKS